MKSFIDSFRNYINEANLDSYAENSTITLYHYAPVDEKEIEIDPSRFGKQIYSKREKERSSYPRSFYYVDLNQAERQVKQGAKLYSLNFPINKIYDLGKDPDGLIETTRHPVYGLRNDIEWTELLKAIHKNYSGVYYSIPGMDVVALFDLARAKKWSKNESW